MRQALSFSKQFYDRGANLVKRGASARADRASWRAGNLRFPACFAMAVLAAPVGPVRADTVADSREAAVSMIFDAAVSSPPRLRMFLHAMPKGGDLHNHLGGSVYAEDFVDWATTEGLCVDTAGAGFAKPPCVPGKALDQITRDQPFAYGRLIDSLSMRGWQRGVGRNDVTGHTQFFGSFDKFGVASHGHDAEALAATRRIAAGDNLSYLELDHNPPAMIAATLATPDVPLAAAGLAARYVQEIAAIGPVLDKAIAELDRDEASAHAAMGCGGAMAEAGCGVAVRYLAWGWRALPPAAVFRSLILAFAMAARDPRFVGVNIVQPEDWPVPLRDYDLHMAMFRFLAAKYPGVRLSLHAGELAFAQVPPGDLRDHIAKAVAAGAQRIGHGADIAYEDDARATIATMARHGIAVEINLSSNDAILGLKGTDHPLSLYRQMGVPVVLSTDDQGVLRTDMTQEYVRAAREQGLRYADLKGVARASLEYAFLPGASLWQGRRLGVPVAACAHDFGDPGCRQMLRVSEKARLQAGLEQRFNAFEDNEIEFATLH